MLITIWSNQDILTGMKPIKLENIIFMNCSLCSILIVKVNWKEVCCISQNHGAEVNAVNTGTSPIWYSDNKIVQKSEKK